METTNGNDILRRSRRLRNVVPELHGLVGPERTPPKNKAVNSSLKKDPYSSSGDDEADSTDKDASETEDSDGGLKDFNGINDFFSSDGRENQTRQFTKPPKISLSRRVKTTPLEPFTQNTKQSSSSFVSRRKVAFENLAGVKEPQCTKSSNVPLNGVRLPTLQVQPTANSRVIYLFSRSWPFIFVILIILMVLICSSYMTQETQDKTRCNSSELKQKFPRQTQKLWNYVESSRSNFKPFVLLLLHDSHDDVASCLAKQIAKDVACHRTQKLLEPKIISGRKGLNRNILMSIRQQLEYSKSLVVLNVEDMDPDAASFFHYILDVEEPWVHGGVYVLTLNIPNINSNSINAYASVRKFLMAKWAKHIEEDNIDPLITRFGNQEYVVKEDGNPCH